MGPLPSDPSTAWPSFHQGPPVRNGSRLNHQAAGDQLHSVRPQGLGVHGYLGCCQGLLFRSYPEKGRWPPPGLGVQDTPDPLPSQLGPGATKSAGVTLAQQGLGPFHSPGLRSSQLCSTGIH